MRSAVVIVSQPELKRGVPESFQNGCSARHPRRVFLEEGLLQSANPVGEHPCPTRQRVKDNLEVLRILRILWIMLPFRVPRRAVPELAGKTPPLALLCRRLPKLLKLNGLQVLWAIHLSNPKGRNPGSDWRTESAQKSFSDSTNKPLKNQG
jgi:hypothetical protein